MNPSFLSRKPRRFTYPKGVAAHEAQIQGLAIQSLMCNVSWFFLLLIEIIWLLEEIQRLSSIIRIGHQGALRTRRYR